jgi:hypothetical protein
VKRLENKPALLVSYVYLDAFLKNQNKYVYRDWVMDSGAFSAWNSGTTIDLNKYIDCCAKLMESDETLTEVFALDVIGNSEASLTNCEKMWEQGVPAIPTFHPGEPDEGLTHIAATYPKIAIGGIVGKPQSFKKRFVGNIFNKVWPKPIHGFGIASRDLIMTFPFASCDATNWEMGPCAFGRWKTFGGMSVRGSTQNLTGEVEWHLKLEREARRRWKKEMKLIGDVDLSVRLAEASDRQTKRQKTKLKALKKASEVVSGEDEK